MTRLLCWLTSALLLVLVSGTVSTGAGTQTLSGSLTATVNSTIVPLPTPAPQRQPMARGRHACDNLGIMECTTGTCYTDTTGLIGCCTASICIPRTTCIDWARNIHSPCNPDTGGCTYCSDQALPFCATITNRLEDQWSIYCAASPTTRITQYYNSIVNSPSTRPVPDMSYWPGSLKATAMMTSTSTSSSLSTSTNTASSSSPAMPAATKTSPPVTTAPPTVLSLQTQVTSSSQKKHTPTMSMAASQDSETSSTATGTIVGVACGAVFSTAAIAIGVCLTWLKCGPRRKRNHTLGDHQQDKTTSSSDTGGPTFITSPALMYSPESYARHAELDGSTTVHMDSYPEAPGLGIRMCAPPRYTLTNPDPPAHDAAPPTTMPPTATDPLDSPLVSPLAPQTPSPSSQDRPAIDPTFPAFAPSSHPACLTPSRGPAGATYIPYTPSLYAPQPPGSLARSGGVAGEPLPPPPPPPSRSQDYSLASLRTGSGLGGGDSSGAGQVDGDSEGQRGHAAPPQWMPWAYLSAEDALGGGWRNGED